MDLSLAGSFSHNRYAFRANNCTLKMYTGRTVQRCNTDRNNFQFNATFVYQRCFHNKHSFCFISLNVKQNQRSYNIDTVQVNTVLK